LDKQKSKKKKNSFSFFSLAQRAPLEKEKKQKFKATEKQSIQNSSKTLILKKTALLIFSFLIYVSLAGSLRRMI